MILPPKIFFSKHQHKVEFKHLDDFEVPSCDFPGLRTSAASMTSTASRTSMASITFTASIHCQFIEKTLILMVGSFLAPKWQIMIPFCGIDHQKSNFSLKLATFLLEAGEASLCYFFKNWLLCLKISNLRIPKPPANKIWLVYFYLPESI